MNDKILDRYLTHTVLVTIQHLGSTGTIAYLNFLSFSSGVIVNEKANRFSKTVQVRFTFTTEANAQRFTGRLDEIFQPMFCRYHRTHSRRFETTLDLLAWLVETMDWHYDMSDDHRVWSGGQQQLDTIQLLIKELAPTKRKAIQTLLKKAGKESMLPAEG